MKYAILIVILFSINLLGQSQCYQPVSGPEIYFHLENIDNITPCEIRAKMCVVDAYPIWKHPDHNTTDYALIDNDDPVYILRGFLPQESTDLNVPYNYWTFDQFIWLFQDEDNCPKSGRLGWKGWEGPVTHAEGNVLDWFYYGFYKISVDMLYSKDGWGTNFEENLAIKEIAYFYIDARDADLGFYHGLPTFGHSIDIWIEYLLPAISNLDPTSGLPLPGNGLNFDVHDASITQITSGDVITYWDLKINPSLLPDYFPNTSKFPSFWENSLILENGNNHPMLIMGYHPNHVLNTQYYIYRKDYFGRKQITKLIATVNLNNQIYYIDNARSMVENYRSDYYVKAKFPDGSYSAASNIVSIYPQEESITSIFNEDQLNQNFMLYGAYPNPFNPSTTISFALPIASNVEIVIFDELGKKVKNLHNSTMNAGYQKLIWNGTNQSNQQVSSGIYFYTFKAQAIVSGNETFIKTSKLLLLR